MSPTADFFSQLFLLLIGIGFSAFYVPYITRTGRNGEGNWRSRQT